MYARQLVNLCVILVMNIIFKFVQKSDILNINILFLQDAC